MRDEALLLLAALLAPAVLDLLLDYPVLWTVNKLALLDRSQGRRKGS